MIFLCLDNDAAAAFEPPADTVVVDLAGAHRLTDDADGEHVVRHGARRVELRPARALPAARAR